MKPADQAMWLLDAHNLLHRYHHAAPVQTQDGQQVHAVRGLASLVTRIKRDYRAEGVALVFDAGHSGRAEIFPGYKAGRQETPLELAQQITMARVYLPRYGCDTIRVDGYEADDVIATMAAAVRAVGANVYMVTSDKDLHAMITDGSPLCAVYNNQRKGGWRAYGEADVRERFGVGPAVLLDAFALTGDSIDGIPGVPGIGMKTAAALIREYGSLDALLGLISTVKRDGLRRRLREHVEVIKLARRLLAPVAVSPGLIQSGLLSGSAGRS